LNIPDILTPRLRLVAITPAALDAQEADPQLLSNMLQATIPTAWPNGDWEPHVYAFMRNQFRDHPHTIGWHRFVLLTKDEETTLIGGLGAHPKSPTECEIGYGILDPWQYKGYATEATRHLMEALFQQGQQRIRAQTFPRLPASLRIMQKCGMTYAGEGEEPGAVCYAINKEDWKH